MQLGVSNPIQQQPSAPIQAAQIVGGATKQMTTGVQPVGGFLPHPQLLAPGGPGKAALVYLKPNGNLSRYQKVIMDPVTIWSAPNSELNRAPADHQRALSNVVYSDF